MAADGSLHDIGFDPKCYKWLPLWLAEAQALASADDPCKAYLAYTIVRKSDQAVIGSVGSSWYRDLCETGVTYFIGAQYRQNGYAVEALQAYTIYFLSHYPLPKLIATVRAENTPSWKTLEKAGFTLVAKRMYQDADDCIPMPYHFYERKQS